MEAICCSEKSGFFQTARRYNREDPYCSVGKSSVKRPRRALWKIKTDLRENGFIWLRIGTSGGPSYVGFLTTLSVKVKVKLSL
jgi:hypothetical protein